MAGCKTEGFQLINEISVYGTIYPVLLFYVGHLKNLDERTTSC